MNTAAIQLGLFVIEEAIKIEPALAAEIKAIFAKDNPTPEDWAALRQKVAARTYASEVTNSVL